MSKIISALLLIILAAQPAHAQWLWGQFHTPKKIILEGERFSVQFEEGLPNPNNCTAPASGVVIQRSLVGDALYEELYAMFLTALSAHLRVEVAIHASCNYGPNVAAATLINW